MKKVERPLLALRLYKPAPHPMQHRIDEFRKVPSLVTGRRYDTK